MVVGIETLLSSIPDVLVYRSRAVALTPDNVAHDPFVHYEATIKDGAITIKVINFTLDVSNALSKARVVSDRNVASIKEGRGENAFV